jgi:hypothetical protein
MHEKEIIGVSSCVGRNWIDAKVCIKCFCDLLTKSVLLSALDDAMNYAERAPNEYKRCCCGIKPFLHHPRSRARARARQTPINRTLPNKKMNLLFWRQLQTGENKLRSIQSAPRS